MVQLEDFASGFEIFGELDLGKACGWEQYHFFIVTLPLVNTKGSGQEISRDVTFAGDMSKFEAKFC